MKKYLPRLTVFALLFLLIPTQSVWALERRNVTNLVALPINDKEIEKLIEKCGSPIPLLETPNDESTLSVVEVPQGTEIVRVLDTRNSGIRIPSLYYACPLAVYNQIQARQKIAEVDSFTAFMMKVVDVVFVVFRLLVDWILRASGYFLAVMLSEGTFIQNDIVKQAWPFMQGIANLGFIFGLLYIALATTLRIESVSTSVQRLLPKLLIGAILVNFSLIIGGLLIDMSRLLMAIEIKLIAGPGVTPTNLGSQLINSIRAYQVVFAALESAGQGIQAYIILSIQTSIVIGALAVGLFIVSINLFIRYVALLVLLIFSPFAYLALALPGAKSFFTQWWGMFLKWVFYGPIVLFFLALIIRVQGTKIINVPESGFTSSAVLQQFIRFAIVITFLYIGHIVGKKAAGVGSEAVLGWAKEHPKTTAAAVGTILTGGMGGAALGFLGMKTAQYTGSTLKNAGRDLYRDTASNIAKRARGTELFGKDTLLSQAAYRIAGAERDKEGNRKPGEQNSLGSWTADKLPFAMSADAKNAHTTVNGITDFDLQSPKEPEMPEEPDANDPNYHDKYDQYLQDRKKYNKELSSYKKLKVQYDKKNPYKSSALASEKLMKKSTAASFSKEQLDKMFKHLDENQQNALLMHRDVIRTMSDGLKAQINAGEYGNEAKKKLDSRMRDLANKE